MAKILIVDDESSIITLLAFNIKKAGYEVLTASDGAEGYEIALSENPDLIVLDLMLPKMDGIEVTKKLRQNKINIPIVIVTAKDEEFDKIIGLELGADDYLTKPFSPREVVARIKAVLRRTEREKSKDPNEENTPSQTEIKIGELTILLESYEVYLNDKQVELTPKEFELVHYLAERRGKVLTRDQLLNAVWGYNYAGETRIVDVHISHLREKIEPDPKKARYIKTVRGFGYKMENVKEQ